MQAIMLTSNNQIKWSVDWRFQKQKWMKAKRQRIRRRRRRNQKKKIKQNKNMRTKDYRCSLRANSNNEENTKASRKTRKREIIADSVLIRFVNRIIFRVSHLYFFLCVCFFCHSMFILPISSFCQVLGLNLLFLNWWNRSTMIIVRIILYNATWYATHIRLLFCFLKQIYNICMQHWRFMSLWVC